MVHDKCAVNVVLTLLCYTTSDVFVFDFMVVFLMTLCALH